MPARGRPPAKLDWQIILQLVRKDYTNERIIAEIGCSRPCFYRQLSKGDRHIQIKRARDELKQGDSLTSAGKILGYVSQLVEMGEGGRAIVALNRLLAQARARA